MIEKKSCEKHSKVTTLNGFCWKCFDDKENIMRDKNELLKSPNNSKNSN